MEQKKKPGVHIKTTNVTLTLQKHPTGATTL